MIDWRGGSIEFAIAPQVEEVAYAPWYAIKLIGKDNREWIYWIDYGGPPQLYLTEKAAIKKAEQLKKQYKESYPEIYVIEIGETGKKIKEVKKTPVCGKQNSKRFKILDL